MKKKMILAIGIVILFVCTTFAGASAVQTAEKELVSDSVKCTVSSRQTFSVTVSKQNGEPVKAGVLVRIYWKQTRDDGHMEAAYNEFTDPDGKVTFGDGKGAGIFDKIKIPSDADVEISAYYSLSKCEAGDTSSDVITIQLPTDDPLAIWLIYPNWWICLLKNFGNMEWNI